MLWKADRRLFLLLPFLGCEVHGFIGSNASAETTSGDTGQIPSESDETGSNDGSSADETAGPVLDVADVPPSYGEWWCVRAEGAATGTGVSITYIDGTFPEGCDCVELNTDEYEWFVDHEDDGEVVIEQGELETELGPANPLVDDLLEVRDRIYGDAVDECLDLAPSGPNNCASPLLFDMDPLTPALEPRPVYRGNRDGEEQCVPEPEGIAPPACSFVAGASHISLISGVYRVPEALFAGFLEEPTCLMHQGWRVGLNSAGSDFIVRGIQTNDALFRLGLRNNDVFVAVEAGGQTFGLTDAEGVINAYNSLRDETEFQIEVRRGSQRRVFVYEIIP